MAPSTTGSAIQLATSLTPVEAGKADAKSQAPDKGQSFAEAVRMERWGDAWSAFDALSEEELSKPTLRLVRGRVALARGDAALATRLLKDLETELPQLRETIEHFRLEAMSLAGPFDEAARAFEKVGSLKALGQAAAAYEKAEKLEEAKRLADRVIARTKSDDEERLARSVRARVAEALGDTTTAAIDARWLSIRAPLEKESLETLKRLAPDKPLDTQERLERAQGFANAGRVDDALAELSRVASMKGAPAREELAFTRGMILYRARRYLAASEAFDKAKHRGKRQAEASFLAARARSRADHDAEAARGYRDVVQRFPKSAQADEASYLMARLDYLHSNWKKAVSGFDGYLKKYPKGRFRSSARYERAVSLLSAKRFRDAAGEFAQLARSEKGHEAARLRALQAKALLGAGDRAGAAKLFTEVATSQPLMFAGQVARARLSEMGAELPKLIEDAGDEPTEALDVALPEVASLYRDLGFDGEAEAWLRGREKELATGPRRGEQLCEMYGKLSRATRRYRLGIAMVPERLIMKAPSPATHWAWQCVYPRPYASIVDSVEEREGLPRGLVHAVMRVESAFDPEAISRARAMGLLQLLPKTARSVADEHGLPFEDGSLTSPPVNIDLGARYLAKMRKTFRGSTLLAAAAYNAGPHAASRWLERSEGLDLDLFVARIPYRETRNYVQRVISNLARYAYLDGGEDAVPALDLKLPKPVKLEANSY